MRMIAAALAASLLLAACSSAPDEEVSPSPSETTTTTESPSPTESATPASAFPLTGVATDEPRLDQPVVSVKIENTPSARPQAGLDRADVVFEEIVEGGVTRFAALFHSDLPAEVGPVRSARLVDVPLLNPWHSILVYSGAREDVTAALRAADHIGLLADPGTGPIFSRAPGRPGSHDLMADLTLALEQRDRLEDAEAVPPPPWTFGEDTPSGGVDQEQFEIAMTSASRSGWEWDADAGVYRRLQNGQPMVVTGEGRVGAANVIVVLTDVGRGGCCDTAGNPFTVTRLEGSGDAILWRDGQRFDITWTKQDVGQHLEFSDASGDPVVLAPGASWIHLAPASAAPAAPDEG